MSPANCEIIQIFKFQMNYDLVCARERMDIVPISNVNSLWWLYETHHERHSLVLLLLCYFGWFFICALAAHVHKNLLLMKKNEMIWFYFVLI